MSAMISNPDQGRIIKNADLQIAGWEATTWIAIIGAGRSNRSWDLVGFTAIVESGPEWELARFRKLRELVAV